MPEGRQPEEPFAAGAEAGAGGAGCFAFDTVIVEERRFIFAPAETVLESTQNVNEALQ